AAGVFRPGDPMARAMVTTRRAGRMRPEYMVSGYPGTKAVVRSRHAGSRSRNSRSTENKVRVCVHIASIDVDHVRLLDEDFAVLQRQFDAVFSWFPLERESARDVGRATLALAGVDVHDFDRSPRDCARTLRTANGPADGAVSLGRFGAEIDDRTSMAAGEAEQRQRQSQEPGRPQVARTVETKYPHIT